MGEKNLIQENTKVKNFKEGHMSRIYRILLFFSKMQRRQTMPGQRGLDTSFSSGGERLTIKDTDNQILVAELEITAPGRNQLFLTS